MKEYSQLQWTHELVAALWDYESRFPKRYFTYRNAGEIIRQLKSHLTEREYVLDYGCGTGHLLNELLKRGYLAAGVDTSEQSVKSVNERFAGHGNFLGVFTPEMLVAQERRFDAILIVEVAEHLYDSDFNLLLDSIRKVIRLDGVAIFTSPNEESLEDDYVFCPKCQEVFHRWQHVRSWSTTSLSQYLEGQGFAIIDAFTTNFSLSLSKKGKRWRHLKKRIRYQLKPNKKRPHLVVVCRLDAKYQEKVK